MILMKSTLAIGLCCVAIAWGLLGNQAWFEEHEEG